MNTHQSSQKFYDYNLFELDSRPLRFYALLLCKDTSLVQHIGIIDTTL